MKIWIIEAGERGEGISLVHDAEILSTGALAYADSAYDEALRAFQATVEIRIGKPRARYEYPGEFGPDAKVEIIARGGCDCGDYDEYVDVVQLRSIEVFGG